MEPRPELRDDLSSRWGGHGLEPMAGDASTRSFWRLRLVDGGTVVVMDYGAPFRQPPDDVALEEIFRRAGLPAARVLDVRPHSGCLVLEDLGDVTLEAALRALGPGAGGEEGDRLYAQAVELAAALASHGTASLAASPRAAGPSLDGARFRFEMDFFVEHYAGALRGVAASSELGAALHALADAAAGSSAAVLCHRDYHSRNLMVRGDGTLAMVDIQDARWGPDAYDLASLLRDAYVEVDEARVDRMIGRFVALRPEIGPEPAFRARFDLVAAQRMIKALGTFGYQTAVRGNPRYREGVPRTLARLRFTLARCPVLADLAGALDRAGLLDPTPSRR